MEVEHEFTVMDDAPAGDMCVAEDHVASGVFLCVDAKAGHHIAPVNVVFVAVVHDFDLPVVNRFEAHVDPSLANIDEPHPGFQAAHIRDRSAFAPVVDAMTEGINHVFIAEIPRFGSEIEFLKQGGRNGDVVHIGRDDFEDGPLENDVGVHFMNAFDERLALFDQGVDARFAAPHPDDASGEFDAGVLHHAQIIV